MPYPTTGVPYPTTGVPYPTTGVVYGQPGIAYGPAGGFHPYAQTLAPVQLPAQRRNGAFRWVVGILTLALVCSLVGLAGLIGYAQYTGGFGTPAAWRPAETPVDEPPEQNAPAAEWSSWARRSVDDTLNGQARALLAADESGYLAAVDPSNSKLVAEHKRRFKVLNAMSPGVWRQTVAGGLKASGERAWDAAVRISYCFGDTTCQPVHISVATEWRFKSDRLVMVGLHTSTSAGNGPRPWETDELSVTTGKRVVLGASRVSAWRLDEAVTFADRAAAVADRFARWEEPPNRYVIFFAGPNDWKQWYGHEQPDWAAAWAVPVSRTVTEIVVRTEGVRQNELEDLLAHELIHVTSLAGKRDGANRSAWWLIEGLAEYGSLAGQPVREYVGLRAARDFVRGEWDGDPAVDPPSSSSSLEEAAARYGIGYLAVRRIAEKHGEEKMLDFFGRMVHDDAGVVAAAPAALGVSWSAVKADCARYIRSSVG
jgi:hypothetical protein